MYATTELLTPCSCFTACCRSAASAYLLQLEIASKSLTCYEANGAKLCQQWCNGTEVVSLVRVDVQRMCVHAVTIRFGQNN